MEITIEVDVPEGISRQTICEWIRCHLDNIPYEELESMGVDSELSEEVSIGVVH